MLNQDPKAKFEEDLADFNLGAALRQFLSDNITMCLIILAVAGIAVIANGTRSILSNRRVGTAILVVMICRAFHAGATANRRIIMKDVTPEEPHDPEQDS